MSRNFLLYVVVFPLLNFVCTQSEKQKRLLISDPQYFENRLQEMESKIQSLTREVETLRANNSKAFGGATFVRWGKKSCPDADSELVYWGYTGGSPYSQTGGAAEYVCLPRDPTFHNILSSSSSIYGSEYQGNFVSGIHNDDVPCAVCRSLRSTSVIMLASREHCYSGWKTEYSGFLASGAMSHVAASQFVCLDRCNVEY